jgi:hypothetical protein
MVFWDQILVRDAATSSQIDLPGNQRGDLGYQSVGLRPGFARESL